MSTEQNHKCGLTSSIIEEVLDDKIIKSGQFLQSDTVPVKFQCPKCSIVIEKDIPLRHTMIGKTRREIVEMMSHELETSTTLLAELVREIRTKECPRLRQMFKKSS